MDEEKLADGRKGILDQHCWIELICGFALYIRVLLKIA